MKTAEIVKLPRVVKPLQKQPGNYTRSMARKLRHQRLASFGIFSVAGALMALSLSHQAKGIELFTDSTTWEAYAMATGIDFGFVMLELSNLLAAHEATRRRIMRFTAPAIKGTLGASGVMNAFAFAGRVPSWNLGADWVNYAPAVILGIAIPAMIYCLTRVGATLYLGATKE
jgi:hypothetical protein